MAFCENIMEHARYVNGVFTYYAEITCDTVADIPDPADHPNWEAGSKLYVLESGGSCYRLSNSREWKPVNFDNAGEGGEGGLDPENYYTMQQVDVMLGSVQKTAEANEEDIAVLEMRVGEMQETLHENTEIQTLCAAPMQDASVEGRYMLFAEYTFPKAANFESADLTLLIRNRGVTAAAEDGILRVRLRYGKASAAFQYAQIYFTQNSGIDPVRFILCCNNATGTAQLYLDASTAYAGYICKVLDMGTSASVVDFSAWTLYSPTSGVAELPAEADGWTVSTGAAESHAVMNPEHVTMDMEPEYELNADMPEDVLM